MTSKATLGAGRTQSPSAFKTLPPARPGKPFSFANRLRQPLFHPIVFLSGFLLIFSRRPDAVSNAQFFAEDGQRWFADAYQLGLRCLLIPDQAGAIPRHQQPILLHAYTGVFGRVVVDC
jgi:hypothetical protein